MNWDRIEGNWQQAKGRVKQRWGKLTDDQIAVINGQRDILAGKLQEAYGLSKDEVDRQIREWEASLSDMDVEVETRSGTRTESTRRT
ncbi:MAG TPA: CsbD family protein [Steroidobacteraceae bacterium]|nr:CsbD family protein [Steroidobacteraceae bacterium]